MATVDERIKTAEEKIEAAKKAYEDSKLSFLDNEDFSKTIEQKTQEYNEVQSRLEKANKRLADAEIADIEYEYQLDLKSGGTMTREEFEEYWKNDHKNVLENEIEKINLENEKISKELADAKASQELYDKYNRFKTSTTIELLDEVVKESEDFFKFAEEEITEEDKVRFYEILAIDDEQAFENAIKNEKELANKIAPMTEKWSEVRDNLFNSIKENKESIREVEHSRKETEKYIAKATKEANLLKIKIEEGQKNPSYPEMILATRHIDNRAELWNDLKDVMKEENDFNRDAVKDVLNKYKVPMRIQDKLLPKTPEQIEAYKKDLENKLVNIEKGYDELKIGEESLKKLELKVDMLSLMSAHAKSQEKQLAAEDLYHDVIEPTKDLISSTAKSLKRGYDGLTDQTKELSRSIGDGISHFTHGIGSWNQIRQFHGMEAFARKWNERKATIAFEEYNQAQKKLEKLENRRNQKIDRKVNKMVEAQRKQFKKEANRLVDEKIRRQGRPVSRKERRNMVEKQKEDLRKNFTRETRRELETKRGWIIKCAQKRVNECKQDIDQTMEKVADNRRHKLERIQREFNEISAQTLDGRLSEKQFKRIAEALQKQYEAAQATTFRNDLAEAMQLADDYSHKNGKAGHTITQLNDMCIDLQTKFDNGLITEKEFDQGLSAIMDEYKKSEMMESYMKSMGQLDKIDFVQRQDALLKGRTLLEELSQVSKMIDMSTGDIAVEVSKGNISQTAYDFYSKRITDVEGKTEAERAHENLTMLKELQQYQKYAEQYASVGISLQEILNQEQLAKDNLKNGTIDKQQFDDTMKSLNELKQGYMDIKDFSQDQLSEIDDFMRDR